MLLTLLLTFTAVSQAQVTEKRASSLSRLLHKHTNNGDFEVPQMRVETPSPLNRASDASGAPLNFPDRVWFPGEWEEVKAVVVSPRYNYVVPGHEGDERYSALQIVKGWGYQYFLENKDAQVQLLNKGNEYLPCKSSIDVETADGMVFLYIMDGIQKGGAEAWVRIEEPGDEQAVRTALQKAGLRSDKLQFFVAPGNSFWFRDCGPICFYYGDDDKLGMLDFMYSSQRANDDLLPSFLHRHFGIPNYINDVVWEGGNCLVDGLGGLVTSTAVYTNNNDTIGRLWWDGKDPKTIRWTKKNALEPANVKAALVGMLGQRQTTFVPRLNYDGRTGHIDLYIDATDENGFMITQMPEAYDFWTDYDIALGNTAILFNKKSFFDRRYYDKGSFPLPLYDDGSYWQSEEEYDKYARTYANHLLCNNYVIQPCFSKVGADGMPTAKWDRENIEKLKKLYPGYEFYCIDMRSFDGSGGSIHCVTKQIPADNPVRIIHKDIYDNVNPGTLDYIPFSTVVTNKSGIKEAKLFYRVKGGEWTEVALNGNGNCWSSDVKLNKFTGGEPLTADGIKVEYYIEATSNNGKTVTKPINARYGAYYNFTLTTNAAYDKNKFDFNTEPMPMDEITYLMDTRWLYEDTTTDTSTGISEVKNTNASRPAAVNDAWYTLDGTRISAPTATGIYIHNGKKYVLKRP